MTMKDVVAFLNQPEQQENIQANFVQRTGRHISLTPVDCELRYVEECDALLILIEPREEDKPTGRRAQRKGA